MILSERIEYNLQQKEIGSCILEDNYDVIVAGLGTAGAVAAIAAAKKGLKVLGIEKLNCKGGTGTTGVVLGYYYGSKGGICEDIDEVVKKMES